MAGKSVWRATHTHVHFFGASFAQVHYARSRGGPAYDRVVQNHYAFSGDHFLDQIQLYAHIEIADQLTWLQKCAANVVVANECVGVRDLQFLSETKSGIISGVGYRYDNVG